jgi:hypothetical protein
MEPKVHYRVHKNPPLDPVLINPIHSIPSCLSTIFFNIVHAIYLLVFLVVSFLLVFPPMYNICIIEMYNLYVACLTYDSFMKCGSELT